MESMSLLNWSLAFAVVSLLFGWVVFWGGAERLEGSVVTAFLLPGRALFREPSMPRFLLTLCVVFTFAGVAAAGRYFAQITHVDAETGVVTYDITFGKNKQANVKANVAKDCVIKEGYYRLGKPATTKELDPIANGLKNAIFKSASPENPLRVNIYTADETDDGLGVKRGDIIKILVNPKAK